VSDEKKTRYARRLTHAEAELWTVVTASVRPFRVRPAPAVPPAPPEPESKPVRAVAALPRLDRPQPAPAPQPKPPSTPQDLDRRERMKIKRGRLDVDAKLDLHGLRQDEAQRALHAFLRRAQSDGAKIVIVVTGTGLSREEGGVLRRAVPMWLQAPNLRDVVVGFGEAARHHGGEGALYVRIRRADRLRGRYD
jgi:DNA-nicking Smr family endonuclease